MCVIGTGCGGATLGVRLAEAGKNVVFVERGGYYTHDDFDQREDDMLAKIDGGRGLDTSDDGSVALTYGNNVGGASVHYWADSYRTPPDRLQALGERVRHRRATARRSSRRTSSVIERDLNVHAARRAYRNRMNQLLQAGRARSSAGAVERVPQARKGCVGERLLHAGLRLRRQAEPARHVRSPRALAAGARIYADTRAERCSSLERQQGHGARRRASSIARPARPRRKPCASRRRRSCVAAGGYGSPRLPARGTA